MRILLIEDDNGLNRGVSFALKKEGFDIESTYNISQGKEVLSKGDINLIILDVNLPDGNGFDFCMEIRKTSNVPIIFLTAQSSELEITNGLDMGADDYITKPFSVRELLSRINALIRRSKVKDLGKTLISNEIILDEGLMKVTKKGREIFLSKKELSLLRYFMINARQIISKEQILSAIWENDVEFVDENVVPVNIKRLREKIEDTPKKPIFIQNIRGLGYIWSYECERR